MITRREVTLFGGVCLLGKHLVGLGQQAPTVRRIAFLTYQSEAESAPYRAALAPNLEIRIVHSDGDANRADVQPPQVMRRPSERGA